MSKCVVPHSILVSKHPQSFNVCVWAHVCNFGMVNSLVVTIMINQLKALQSSELSSCAIDVLKFYWYLACFIILFTMYI